MRLRWMTLMILGSVFVAACAPRPRAVEPRRLTLPEVVDSTVSTPPLDRTHWGIEVFDPATGRMVYRLNPEKHFVPASNTKLVVTAVGLGELGPDYRYTTELYGLGAAPGDTAVASLLVVGRGDPTMSARFFDSDFAVLDSLADSVALAGVRRITGDVVVDASYFDSTFVHPTWEVGDLPWYYAAPTAAFAVGEGTFPVVIEPGAAPGVPARLQVLAPEDVIGVRSALVTDTAGADFELDVSHRVEADSVVVLGQVPLDAEPDTFGLSVIDPPGFAARALVAALEARGVTVDGGVRVVYDSLQAAALRAPSVAPARRLAAWTSPPLSEIVAAILKPSQNWMAEQLLKTLGAEVKGEGSWPAGIEVEEEYLVNVAGIDSTAIFLRDGSGLSAQNLLAPHAVVQLLAHARRSPWGPVYRAAMAEPGVEGTTLRSRLEGLEGRVYAKTGTIMHVNALSGYLTTFGGRELIFSVLTNGSGRPSSEVRAAIDRIVQSVARTGGRE